MTHRNAPLMSTKQFLMSTNAHPSFRKYLCHVPNTCLPSRAPRLSRATMLASVSMSARISWVGRFRKPQILIPRAQTINNKSFPATIITAPPRLLLPNLATAVHHRSAALLCYRRSQLCRLGMHWSSQRSERWNNQLANPWPIPSR